MSNTEKWNGHTLTVEDIEGWLEPQAEAEKVDLTPEQRHTVARNIHKIYETVEGIRPDYLGHFLTAVRKNDYTEALARADLTNRRALILYLKYFYNQAPRSFYDQ